MFWASVTNSAGFYELKDISTFLRRPWRFLNDLQTGVRQIFLRYLMCNTSNCNLKSLNPFKILLQSVEL